MDEATARYASSERAPLTGFLASYRYLVLNFALSLDVAALKQSPHPNRAEVCEPALKA